MKGFYSKILPCVKTFHLSHIWASNFHFHFQPPAKVMTSRGGHPNLKNFGHHPFLWPFGPKWSFKKVSLLLASLCTRRMFLKHSGSHYMVFHPSSCWSSVGRKFWVTGYQELSLGPGCMVQVRIFAFLHSFFYSMEDIRTYLSFRLSFIF